MAAANPQDAGKKAAGYAAVQNFVRGNPDVRQAIGVGSGSTVVFVADALAERVQKEGLDVVCVPTSFQSRQLIIERGLRCVDLNQYPSLDVCFDGADEVDDSLNLIKGGGGCHLLEKLVASAAEKLVIVVDSGKVSQRLGERWKKGIPVEVLPDAYTLVSQKIRKLGGQARLRMAANKAGPVVTDTGNFILDADFGILDCQKVGPLDSSLGAIPGVLGTGLFPAMAGRVVVGSPDGSHHELSAPGDEPRLSPEALAAKYFLGLSSRVIQA